MKVVVVGVLGLVGCAAPPAVSDGELLVEGICTTERGSPIYFASASEYLYWIAPCDSSIRRASKQTGAVEVFVADEPDAGMLAVDDSFVYWARVAASGRGELVRASQLHRDVVTVAPGQDEMYTFLPQQLVVDDTTLYRSRVHEIVAMPKDGSGASQTFAVGDSGPFLTTDSAYVYWANLGSVYRQRKGTSTAELLAQPGSVIFDPIAVTNNALFYWESSTLFRIDKTTAGRPVSVRDDSPTHGFISDGEAQLYWQSGAYLVRANEDGLVTPISQVLGTTEALALDDQFVYWIDNGSIYRTSR